MRWLVNLYPDHWQHRYGAEFGALLEASPMSARLLLDVVRGARDAHWNQLIERGIAMPKRSRLLLLASVGCGLVALTALLCAWVVPTHPTRPIGPAYLEVERHLATAGLSAKLERVLQEAAKSIHTPAIYVIENEAYEEGVIPGPVVAASRADLVGELNASMALQKLRQIGAVSPIWSLKAGIQYRVKAPDGKTYAVYIVEPSLPANFKESARLTAVAAGMLAIFLALWTRRPSVAAIPIEPR